MTKTNEHPVDVTDEVKDRFAVDIETLKSSFAQLRDDLTKLIDNTLGTGKDGAGMLKDRASTAVVDFEDRMCDLKDCGVDSIEKIGEKIGERPLLSAAIALGIGFVLAKLFATRR